MHVINRFEQPSEDHSTLRAKRLLIHQKINRNTTSVVAFSGCSMNPTLIDGDLVEVLSYGLDSVKVGDIIYFQLPTANKAIIHRVVRLTSAGVITRGDNHCSEDVDPVPSRFIFGKVTAVWRNSRWRKMAGGCKGMAYKGFYQIILACGNIIIPIIRPFSQRLVLWEGIYRYLPQRFRPKVVAFRNGKETYLRLVWWKRIIGQYDFRRSIWKIYRPFRLLFSEKTVRNNEQRQREVS